MEEKEFEEKAIPLITEGFDLETDGMEFLQKLSDKNIAVISIIGPSNSGKSFLANQLSDKVNQGFEINTTNTKDSCTKGIWVWGKPIIKDNYYIIILDVQGLRVDSDENLEYSKKIFTLSTLISSIVIYNYKEDGNIEINKLNNDIIQHSYDLFNKMIQLLPKLKLEDNEELSEDQNKITKAHIPDFIWIYRDSITTDFNCFNDLEKNFMEKNEYFNSLFKNKIKKYSLSCPMDINKMKSNDYLNMTGEIPFTKEYKSSFDILKNKIVNNCKPKIIKELSLNGNLFYGLLQEYASMIFSGDDIYVESPLSNAVLSNLGDITENITETFKEKLEEKNTDIYDIQQILKNSFEILSDESDGLLNIYHENFIGKLLHCNFMIYQMNNILSSVSDEVLDTNIGEKLNQFNESIKELIEKESKKKKKKIESIPDIKKNLNDLANEIKNQIEENIFKKENEFLNSFAFIKDYIIKCIYDKINAYADSIAFYVEHNLQTIESGSKLNESAFEAKNKELNEKENELNKYKIELEKINLNMKEKEKEYELSLSNEKEKYINLEKNLKKIISEKDVELEKLENKIKDIYKNINREDFGKIKNENLQLKLDLGLRDKQITALNSKLSEIKELEEKKRKVSNYDEETNLNISKNKDIPKLKEIFKEINTTLLEYSSKIKILEKNKDIVFGDKFIETTKSNWNKTDNDWKEKLNKFKENHYITMINKYNNEISELKKENKDLINEFKEYNEKIIENMKLNQQILADKEMLDIKQDEINKLKEKAEKAEKKLVILQGGLVQLENELAKYKDSTMLAEHQIDIMIRLIGIIINKEKKIYLQYYNKLRDEYKQVFNDLGRIFNIFK